jgi:DNA-binding response OmpR family regulator
MTSILMIDDDGLYCDVVEQVLADHGHAVVTVQNCAEGIALCRALSPDLVIADMGMPDTDGEGIIRSIRAINNQVRIIALSAAATIRAEVFLKMAKNLDADAAVHKLDTLDRLIAEVRALVRSPA